MAGCGVIKLSKFWHELVRLQAARPGCGPYSPEGTSNYQKALGEMKKAEK
jgi:hypothetical protein